MTKISAAKDPTRNVWLQLGLPDGFLDHGSREELLAQAGLDAASIESAIRARFGSFKAASSLRNVS